MLRLVLLASVLGVTSLASAQAPVTEGAARTETTEEPDAEDEF